MTTDPRFEYSYPITNEFETEVKTKILKDMFQLEKALCGLLALIGEDDVRIDMKYIKAFHKQLKERRKGLRVHEDLKRLHNYPEILRYLTVQMELIRNTARRLQFVNGYVDIQDAQQRQVLPLLHQQIAETIGYVENIINEAFIRFLGVPYENRRRDGGDPLDTTRRELAPELYTTEATSADSGACASPLPSGDLQHLQRRGRTQESHSNASVDSGACASPPPAGTSIQSSARSSSSSRICGPSASASLSASSMVLSDGRLGSFYVAPGYLVDLPVSFLDESAEIAQNIINPDNTVTVSVLGVTDSITVSFYDGKEERIEKMPPRKVRELYKYHKRTKPVKVFI